jgi:Fe-S-cluster containining protein
MSRQLLILSRSYARCGSELRRPAIHGVDPFIFTRRYYARCMSCSFCHDMCCHKGADIDLPNIARLLNRADELEHFCELPRRNWFTQEVTDDEDLPGGKKRPTEVVAGACSFLNRRGRGCCIHAFCHERNLDYHDYKPLVCWLFPLTIEAGVLQPAQEVSDESLVCMHRGPTLYEGQRNELMHAFGPAFVNELDGLQDRRGTARSVLHAALTISTHHAAHRSNSG